MSYKIIFYESRCQSAISGIVEKLEKREFGPLASFSASDRQHRGVKAIMLAGKNEQMGYVVLIQGERGETKGEFMASLGSGPEYYQFGSEENVAQLFIITCRALVDGVSPRALISAASDARADGLSRESGQFDYGHMKKRYSEEVAKRKYLD